MKRVPVTVLESSKVPEGQDCWITSVNNDQTFWLLWVNPDGTKSRCKESLAACAVYDRMFHHRFTCQDINGLWRVDH